MNPSMVMNVEAEIRDLKRRVGELEGSFGFLTDQVKSVHRDLLAFRADTEQFQAKTEQFQAKTEQRFDRVEKSVKDLRADMPGIVGSTMREVLRERENKSRKAP
jgi:cytochrome c556